MPSRAVVAIIVLFWLTTTGFVVYRDIWPRLFATGPPPIAVDLADEASQLVPVNWQVYRGDQKIGRLSTRMTHIDDDDTFEFTHRYKQLQFDFSGVRIFIPELTNVTRLTRSGDLRQQSMTGQLLVQLAGPDGSLITVAEARAKVHGRVEQGQFVGHCELDSPLFKIDRDLEPIPVADGQALNPLQPVNRIANVRAGQQWLVQEINPLDEALSVLVNQQLVERGMNMPKPKREPLLATVSSAPENLEWRGEIVSCWVIEYRGREARARTWLRVSDGKVLRQEAFGRGERISLERDD